MSIWSKLFGSTEDKARKAADAIKAQEEQARKEATIRAQEEQAQKRVRDTIGIKKLSR
jgi:sterol desaturase/sphingolipid hydroxylase (fatty acid hydroxylase superfamily)